MKENKLQRAAWMEHDTADIPQEVVAIKRFLLSVGSSTPHLNVSIMGTTAKGSAGGVIDKFIVVYNRTNQSPVNKSIKIDWKMSYDSNI